MDITFQNIRDAAWCNWPHVGEAYRIRNRGNLSWYSTDGIAWRTSYGEPVTFSQRVRFHGGNLDGKVQ
jgi:hypothetical protein